MHKKEKLKTPHVWTGKNVRSLNPNVIFLCDGAPRGWFGLPHRSGGYWAFVCCRNSCPLLYMICASRVPASCIRKYKWHDRPHVTTQRPGERPGGHDVCGWKGSVPPHSTTHSHLRMRVVSFNAAPAPQEVSKLLGEWVSEWVCVRTCLFVCISVCGVCMCAYVCVCARTLSTWYF